MCRIYVWARSFHRNPFHWKCMKVHNTTALLPFIFSSLLNFILLFMAAWRRAERKISFSTKYSSSLSPCIRFIACDITKGNKVEQHNTQHTTTTINHIRTHVTTINCLYALSTDCFSRFHSLSPCLSVCVCVCLYVFSLFYNFLLFCVVFFSRVNLISSNGRSIDCRSNSERCMLPTSDLNTIETKNKTKKLLFFV